MLQFTRQRIHKTAKQAAFTILDVLNLNQQGTAKIKYDAAKGKIVYTTNYVDQQSTVWHQLGTATQPGTGGGSADMQDYYTKEQVQQMIQQALNKANSDAAQQIETALKEAVPAAKVESVEELPEVGTQGTIYSKTDGTQYIYHNGRWQQLGAIAYETYQVI